MAFYVKCWCKNGGAVFAAQASRRVSAPLGNEMAGRAPLSTWLRSLVVPVVTLLLAFDSQLALASSLFVIAPDHLPLSFGFINGGNSKSPAHLPANAKGVLFQTGAQVTASNFQILKVSSGKRVAAVVVPLRALHVVPPGTIDNIAPFPQMLFRIEPVDGFEPGHVYRFLYNGVPQHENYFYIDTQVVRLREARVERIGEPNRENMLVAEACRDDPYGVGVMQSFRIDGPRQWLPYKHRILTLLYPVAGSPWRVQDPLMGMAIYFDPMDARARQMWQSQPRYLCASTLNNGAIEVGMSAQLAFLEIDDAWLPARPARFTLSAKQLTERDSLDYLKQAIATSVSRTIVGTLEAIPIRATDQARSYATVTFAQRLGALRRHLTDREALARRAELLQLISTLVGHPDPAVRVAAGAARARLAIHRLRIQRFQE